MTVSIQELIKNSPYNQRQIAALIGTSDTRLSFFLAGKDDLKFRQVQALAKLIGCELNDFTGLFAEQSILPAGIPANA